MRVLMLGHYSRTGKDSLASWIEYYCDGFVNVKKVSFAHKLKDVCHQLYGWAGLMDPAFYESEEGAQKRNEILPHIDKTPIEIWVDFGTLAVRDNVYQRTWIDYVLHQDYRGVDLLIVPDTRFLNEIEAFEAVDHWEVKTGKLVRETYGPKNTVADMSLIDYEGWSRYFGGDMEDLKKQAEDISLWARGGEFPMPSEEETELLKGLERR